MNIKKKSHLIRLWFCVDVFCSIFFISFLAPSSLRVSFPKTFRPVCVCPLQKRIWHGAKQKITWTPGDSEAADKKMGDIASRILMSLNLFLSFQTYTETEKKCLFPSIHA